MPRHWLLAAGTFLFLLFFSSAFFSWLTVQLRLPILQDLVVQAQAQAVRDSQAAVHNNLQLMATRLGELQAQLQQIKSVGERLSATIQPSKANLRKPDGQGGPMVPFTLTEDSLRKEIDRLGREIDRRGEEMSILESTAVEQRVLSRFLPTAMPVAGVVGSGFGYREDPITGRRALHEGLDFRASVGTPVMAAASGVVVGANYHSEYGNLIVIDHGMDLVTRYAHLSRMNVGVGQRVRQGELIGAVGNTGRSTGPHLHFEVRSQGVVLNPSNFLSRSSNLAQRMSPATAAGAN